MQGFQLPESSRSLLSALPTPVLEILAINHPNPHSFSLWFLTNLVGITFFFFFFPLIYNTALSYSFLALQQSDMLFEAVYSMLVLQCWYKSSVSMCRGVFRACQQNQESIEVVAPRENTDVLQQLLVLGWHLVLQALLWDDGEEGDGPDCKSSPFVVVLQVGFCVL